MARAASWDARVETINQMLEEDTEGRRRVWSVNLDYAAEQSKL